MAMCCFLIATKFQGPQGKVPVVKALNACSKNTYTGEMIVTMEALILSTLEWRMEATTPLHFVDHLLSLGVAQLSDLIDGSMLGESDKLEKIPRRLRQFAEFFVRLCLEDHAFCKYMPSLLAAASVATSRYVLTVTPLWPEFLEARTGYSEAQIYEPLRQILQYSSKRFPEKFQPVPADAKTTPRESSSAAAAKSVSPVTVLDAAQAMRAQPEL